MLTNLLWPWVLARLLTGLCAAGLCSYALLHARAGQLRADGGADEQQLADERRAELAAAVVRAALGFSLLSLVLSVWAADGLSHSVRGAMCAWGVFESGSGFPALGVSVLTAVSAGSWLALHRYDFALSKPLLTSRKFRLLSLLVPLVWLDLLLSTAFFYRLDLGAAASCCSAGLDAISVPDMPGSAALARGSVALAAAVAIGGAIALNLRSARTPSPTWVTSASVGGALAFVLSLPAILWYVAPHAYGTPHHACPFCLLHADVWGIGWPLFGALLWALTDNLSLLFISHAGRSAGAATAEPELTSRTLRALSRRAAVAWGVTLLAGATPVVHWAIVSGGGRLF